MKQFLSTLRWLTALYACTAGAGFVFAAADNTATAASTAAVSGAAAAAEVDIQANVLEYDDASRYAVASGSVTVTWGDRVLKADTVRFWIDRESFLAEGAVSLKEKRSVLFSDRMTFDYRASTGSITRVSGYFDPWFIHAQEIDRVSTTTYTSGRLFITTCDLPGPHYSIRARRARIVVGKKIVIYHPVFYVGPVPMLYFPVWQQNLTAPRYSIEVRPGYNNEDGFTARTIFGYPLSKYSYGKLYLDYFGRRGWGEGAEYNFFRPGIFQGTVYTYHAKDEVSQNENWNDRIGYWYKINRLWSSRADVNYVNNTSLNTLYFNDNWRQQSSQINSSLALTRQSGRSNLQISVNRIDAYNPLTGNYDLSTFSVPRFDYTLFSVFPRLPLTNSLSGFIQNQYTSANGYYSLNGFLNANARKGYSLLPRRLTFNPSVGITETWNDRTSATDLTPSFITRYYTDLNFRYYPFRNFTWDAGYSYTLRSAKNSLLYDENAIDFGEERNQVYFQNLYTYRRLSVRNSTSYDLRLGRFEVLDDWRRKFSPLINELTWLPGGSLSLYLREENSIYPAELRSVQSLFGIGRPDLRYLNLGAFYQSAAPNDLGFMTGFGFWPTSKWKLDYRISATALNHFSDLRASEQELQLYRDLHCWEFKVTYRKRLNAEEIFFQMNLKASSANRQKLYNLRDERQFYPWR